MFKGFEEFKEFTFGELASLGSSVSRVSSFTFHGHCEEVRRSNRFHGHCEEVRRSNRFHVSVFPRIDGIEGIDGIEWIEGIDGIGRF